MKFTGKLSRLTGPVTQKCYRCVAKLVSLYFNVGKINTEFQYSVIKLLTKWQVIMNGLFNIIFYNDYYV